MPRNQPPHFKVRTSIANHEKMKQVWADNDLLALWLRLGVHAIEVYADRTSDVFLVQDKQLPALTGCGRPDIARTWLRRLADVSPISAERDGHVWRIVWRNFAKKQFPFREHVKLTPPSASASASTSPSKNLPLPSADAEGGDQRATKQGQRRPRTTEAPEGLTRDQKASILAWAQQHVASGDLPKGAADPKRLAAWVEACLDHFRAGAKRKADWTATCRNWIRRAAREEMLGKTNGTRHAQAGDQGPAYWRPSKLPETSPSGEPLVRVVRSQEAR